MSARTRSRRRRGGPIRILHVGAGQHSRDSLFPAYVEHRERGTASVHTVLDLDEAHARANMAPSGLSSRIEEVDPTKAGQLRPEVHARVTQLIVESDIDLVVVETPPEDHIGYAMLALQLDRSLFLDKPVSAHPNSTSQETAARAYLKEWRSLARLRRDHPDVIAVVNAHRRREPAYIHGLNELRAVAQKYGQAVTSADLHHGDGQLRTWAELVSSMPHGFLLGAGKLVHSGPHVLDLLGCVLAAGSPEDARPTHARVMASLTLPRDLRSMITDETMDLVLGDHDHDYDETLLTDPGLGEVDARLLIEVLREGQRTATVGVNLLHSGVSDRTWPNSHPDTYRKNGRKRHLDIVIYQAMLQRLDISSHQARQPSATHLLDDLTPGGLNHCAVTTWPGATANPEPRTVHAAELLDYTDARSELYHDRVKTTLIGDVIDALAAGNRRSPILDFTDLAQHGTAPALTTAAYLSHQAAAAGENPLIEIELPLPTVDPPTLDDLRRR